MRMVRQPIVIVMTMNIIRSGIEMMTNIICHRIERPESHILERGCIMTTMTSSFRENYFTSAVYFAAQNEGAARFIPHRTSITDVRYSVHYGVVSMVLSRTKTPSV